MALPHTLLGVHGIKENTMANTPELESVQIERVDCDLFNVTGVIDGAGHTFIAHRMNNIPNKNETWAQLIEYGPDMHEVRRWKIYNVNHWKIDTISMLVEDRDLVILTGGHSLVEDPLTHIRPSSLGAVRIAGVYTPIPIVVPAPVEDPTPCVPPGNRRYFKPNKVVTRGQVAKMIAIASGRADPNNPVLVPTQTFEDVPVGSTFHEYIEVLTEDQVMGGYPCTP